MTRHLATESLAVLVAALICSGCMQERTSGQEGRHSPRPQTESASRPQVERPERPTVDELAERRPNVFEERDVLFIEHGTRCGESEVSAAIIAGSGDLPAYVDRALIFLNGWQLQYVHDDHEVKQIAVRLTDVRFQNGTISWTAKGQLRDWAMDDPFRFCYTYTILAWNSNRIDALPVDLGYQTIETVSTDLSLVSLHRVAEHPSFNANNPVPLLLSGFDYNFREGVLPADHSLLQLAYNLGPSSSLRYDSNTLRLDPRVAHWHSQAIFKDNNVQQFTFGESVVALAGRSVRHIEPPFTIRPTDDPGSGCITTNGAVKRQAMVVEGLSFDYAIPVLSGWDLQFECDDEHVRYIGVWLEDIRYQPPANGALGTLRYTVASVLKDKEGLPSHTLGCKVGVLGFVGPNFSQPTPPPTR